MQIASLEAQLKECAPKEALTSKDSQIEFLKAEISQLKSTLDDMNTAQSDGDMDQSRVLQMEANVQKQSATIEMLEEQVILIYLIFNL